MMAVEFQSVGKVFRHRPALFNLFGRERSGETIALNDVSFSSALGEVVALLGPNGSGKTTLLKLVSTTLLPDSGSVRVAGFDSQRHSAQVRRHVGIAVATERSFFPRLSARENLDFFATLDDVPRRERAGRIEELLRTVRLEDYADTLVMKFSSGLYQRLGLARALLKRPSVLLLDEPTRSLDAASTQALWSTITALARGNAAIFLATHNFTEAATLARRVLFLHQGALIVDRAIASRQAGSDLRALYFRLTGTPDLESEQGSIALHPVEAAS